MLSRRDFLKAACLTGTTATLAGCADPVRRLIPFVIPPEDLIPGMATWYATTCRECPAGCGLLAKNRDGRIIKVEGNPLHPVNGGKPWGKLCARGQASVHGLFNPSRFRGPRQKNRQGELESITWEEAEGLLVQNLRSLAQQGRGEGIVFITDLITGAERDLLRRWLKEMGSTGHVLYEPFAYESLRRANQIVFGSDRIPYYQMEQADFLISFGANFLETWLSNVDYARQFAAFHAPQAGRKNIFVYVGPRLSMTAANADQWVSVPPGGESFVARGLLRLLLEEDLSPPLSADRKEALRSLVGEVTPEAVEGRTGLKVRELRLLARLFARAKKPLALAEGMNHQDPQALETAVAANLLCTLLPGTGQILNWGDSFSLSEVARAQEMKALTERMLRGEVRLLLVCRANPLFSLPPSWEVQRAWQKVPLVVSFSSYPDETGAQAGLILPTPTFLESWGEYAPRKSVRGLMQPAMGPVFNTRQLGDFLLSTGKKISGPEKFPWKDFYEYLKASWAEQEGRPGGGEGTFWEERLQEGGVWGRRAEPFSPSRPGAVKFSFSPLSPARAEQGFHFIAYPTIQFFDGRMANRPFLQELPDPLTQITWGGWVEIHPDDAEQQKIQKGDLLTLRSAYGALIAPAFPYPGITRGMLAMPIGQGHTSFGRYAATRSENPVQLLPPHLDPAGGLIGSLSGVAVIKVGDLDPVAHVDGSPFQHGRNLAQALSLHDYQDLKGKGEPPSIYMPLPSGFSKETDFYPPHPHARYRWAMVVDLDRCIGCAACVVACYAENNVPWVGKRDVLKGRKMSWLQVERYFEDSAPRVRFLPMLCQHCEIAPCESVCPVFAPQHSPEGINNQVYNRCIGTRFCSQNCPWKIRRFNWFTYPHPEPLHWQLNPDVTVRQKGVMEKCSFCIQRIVEAKVNARSQGRAVRDGEFTVACAQTCPADVLTFGNLLDPNSRVSRLIRDPRAYQVLGHLQTKTAVIYLKKLTVEVKA